MKLDPMICGEWDGCAAWLQWSAAGEGAKYDVRVRFRKAEDQPWTKWLKVVPRQGKTSTWAVIPLWRQDYFCEAQVRVSGPATDEEQGWETAAEVTFKRCTALFEFSSTKYDQHFKIGNTFHAQVDAAACVYELTEELEIRAGEAVTSKMRAVGASGYFQLDYPGHFDIRPSFGFRVRNLEPSDEDVERTGRMFTVLKAKERMDVVMAVGAPERR
jgi:hypothetical protein